MMGRRGGGQSALRHFLLTITAGAFLNVVACDGHEGLR